MDERAALLAADYQAGRYTRRQFVRKAFGLGLTGAALSAVLEIAGDLPISDRISSVDAANSQQALVIGIPEATEKPDPPLCVEYGDITVINNNINEGVVRTKNGTAAIEPCLAKDWDISPDGRTYTFHLRPATFHDGTPVTADAIKLNFDRQTDDKNPYHFSGETMTDALSETSPAWRPFRLIPCESRKRDQMWRCFRISQYGLKGWSARRP